MPLAVGTRFGLWEILAPIGAGGMGEVWKARDTRLDRVVAIKISQEKFSDRFEREARAISALNHPNICQLYDVGSNYLVLEVVEGTPLKGSLAADKAIGHAGQILDARDAAHRKGITHRDLKPANILVTKQGIKLLDFAGEASCSPEGDYVSSDFKLMAVSLKLGTEAVEPSAPRELFKLPAVDTGFSPYAAAPDGQRFLVRATPQQQAAEPLTVIVNWPALLKKAATAQ
jgi:serine/threonine protein kinase